MPTYEYRCKRCGSRFDVVLPITSNPASKRRCVKCNAKTASRTITAGASVMDSSRVTYPLVDWQLPLDRDGKPRVVNSARQHRELARRLGYEMNQGYARDLGGIK